MTKRQVAIFLSIFLGIYGSINYYIFIRGYQGLEGVAAIRPFYTVLFIFIAASYVSAKFIEQKTVNILTDILVWIGSFWFAFILYFLLSIVLIDLLRLVNHFTHAVSFDPSTYPDLKLYITAGLFAAISLAILLGYRNAKNLKVKTFTFAIDKYNPVVHELTLVMASDIHLGTIIGRKPTRKIVEKINSLDPDIILLPGDIVDSEIKPIVRLDLGAVLRELKAKYGVYGVTGNHEYIGGIEESVKYIGEHRIKLLRDEVLEVAGITLVGREDYTIKNRRKSLGSLLESVDMRKGVVLMDHQPFHLEEAEQDGVDLQVSGHTHRGQMWPLNYITRMVYEIDWGYLKKGSTHVYVSSGAGTWGPPVKIANDAEIIRFILRFRPNSPQNSEPGSVERG